MFLVNQRDILRRGLRVLIEESDDLVVAGEATGRKSSLDAIAAADPDVVLVDAGASHSDAVEVLQTLHDEHAGVPRLILDHQDGGRTTIGADGDAYLSDDTSEGELRTALRRVAQESGSSTIGPPASVPLDEQERTPALTYREGQVLRLIAMGLTNRQIGDRLGLAEKTVKNYISTLLAKLHFERRTQAAVYQITHEHEHEHEHERAPRRGAGDHGAPS